MTLNNDQQKLAEWLGAYALQRQLTDGLTEIEAAGPPPDFRAEPAAAEGQIRLWPLRQLAAEPLYGLVMACGYARWRVFPFSPFLTPAVPEEFLLKSEGPARVLEGWNARELDSRQTEASWCVETLPAAELHAVKRWWLMLSAGQLDGDLSGERVGPPLRHPLDPRHAYLEAEAMRADWSLAESGADYGSGIVMDLAAEPENGYGKKSEKDEEE